MMSSNCGLQMQYTNEMAINDFFESTTLTNEDIAEILLSTNMFVPENEDLMNRTQVRKRSRATKHTPTTFLNAKASDFRALVQQLTGCQSGSSYKGPVNLNFGAPEDEGTEIDKVSAVSMLEFNFCDQGNRVKNQKKQHDGHDQQHNNLEDNQRLHEEQESSNSGGDDFVSAYTSHEPCSTMMDDYLDMENMSIHDFLDYGEYNSLEMVGDEDIIYGDNYSSGYGLADEAILFCGY